MQSHSRVYAVQWTCSDTLVHVLVCICIQCVVCGLGINGKGEPKWTIFSEPRYLRVLVFLSVTSCGVP